MGRAAAVGVYAPIAWMLLIGCWVAAIASFIGRTRRRKLLDNQSGIGSLRQMSWRQFEQLAGEAFRRQGYAIEETGLGGADGGIDLILRRNGQTTLVQCKQWQSRQVGVKVVREMYGVLIDQQADSVKIIALGDYTADARQFAQGKPIELIHGGQLIATVRSLQTTRARTTELMDTPLALIGSMAACLLVIGVLSPATTTAPTPVGLLPIAIQTATQPMQAPTHQSIATSPQHPQATIYMSDAQNAAQLREWKKRNAESMKILEKTTKEMPLR
jgi:restriction system protein